MKHLIIATCLVASSAHAEFFDGNKLLSYMNNTESVAYRSMAMGYVTGVFDALHGIMHCPPPNVTTGQVNDMVRNHLEINPSTRHVAADGLVTKALSAAWPCAKKSGTNL